MPNVSDLIYVRIHVSKNSNQVYAMNFDQAKLFSFSSPNDSTGAEKIEAILL